MSKPNPLAERLAIARSLKADIDMNQRVLSAAEGTPFYDEIKRINDEMKDRLASFDVYNQKPMYECWRCHEKICVCDTQLQ